MITSIGPWTASSSRRSPAASGGGPSWKESASMSVFNAYNIQLD